MHALIGTEISDVGWPWTAVPLHTLQHYSGSYRNHHPIWMKIHPCSLILWAVKKFLGI